MADEFSENSGSKTKLINDMISLMQRLDSEFAKVEASSKNISANLKSAGSSFGGISGSGGTGSSGQIAQSTGTFSGSSGSYTQSQGGMGGIIGTILGGVAGVAGAAANMMPSVQQAVSSQLLTSQAKFTGMQGNVNATVSNLMGMGTTNGPLDVQQAIAQGAASGILPGLPGYNNNIMPGVMQISNLTGSASSAMQATSALNQAGSVNTLRMMGINVRGANGAERNPADIFKDIYNFAVSQSGGKLNKSNIAIALQPGNGLANLLDAAAGGDSTLRGALQTAALAFAQGGDLSKASLTKAGQLTAALNSASSLNQSEFNLTAASQNPEAAGYAEANRILGNMNNSLAKLVSTNSAAAAALKQLAKGETLLGSNLGQSLEKGFSSIATMLGTLGILKKGEGLLQKGGGLLKTAGKDVWKFLKGAGKDVEAIAPELEVGAEVVGEEAVGAASDVVTGGAGTVAMTALAAAQIASVSGSHGGASAQTYYGQTSSLLAGTPSAGAGASLVVSTAASQIGVPYSWGGGGIQGPSSGISQGAGTVGFDCSSFVQYVFGRLGVILPRTTYEQVKCGTPINPTQAQPGDLLFVEGTAQAPGHVMIYVGNNQVIQAPHTGASVQKTGVDLGSVLACRRVINSVTGTTANTNLLTGAAAGTPGTYSDIFTGSNEGGGGSFASAIAGLLNAGPGAGTTAVQGGSGLGLGSSSGNTYGSNTMAKSYLSFNSKTGILEGSATSSSPTINYGGVTIPITVPQGSTIDAKELASMIKTQLTSIGIHAKVATN